jgi:hypothetical protein
MDINAVRTLTVERHRPPRNSEAYNSLGQRCWEGWRKTTAPRTFRHVSGFLSPVEGGPRGGVVQAGP